MTQEKRRDLEIFLAEKVMGWVPCDRWKPINMGCAGGPAMIKECEHDKCYPTITNGPVGGPPKYTTDLNQAWRLLEKASSWDMSSSNAGTYCAVTVEIMPTAALPEGDELTGEIIQSEAWDLCKTRLEAFDAAVVEAFKILEERL